MKFQAIAKVKLYILRCKSSYLAASRIRTLIKGCPKDIYFRHFHLKVKVIAKLKSPKMSVFGENDAGGLNKISGGLIKDYPI